MLSGTTLTPREAAFVLDEPPKSITKLLDTYLEKGRVAKRGGVQVRQLTEPDLLFILALKDAEEDLSPRGRKGLFDAIKTSIARPNAHTVHFGALNLDFLKYEQDLKQRLNRYQKLKDSVVVSKPGAEPLIRGTEIEVYRISALLDGGMSEAEILRDYPSLKQEHLEGAKAYAVANPKHGRPYPKTTLKKSLRSLAFDFPDDPSE